MGVIGIHRSCPECSQSTNEGSKRECRINLDSLVSVKVKERGRIAAATVTGELTDQRQSFVGGGGG